MNKIKIYWTTLWYTFYSGMEYLIWKYNPIIPVSLVNFISRKEMESYSKVCTIHESLV